MPRLRIRCEPCGRVQTTERSINAPETLRIMCVQCETPLKTEVTPEILKPRKVIVVV